MVFYSGRQWLWKSNFINKWHRDLEASASSAFSKKCSDWFSTCMICVLFRNTKDECCPNYYRDLKSNKCIGISKIHFFFMSLYIIELNNFVQNNILRYISHLVCPDGWFSDNCSSECPFPYYGHLCTSTCDCDNETCNHVTGCNSSKTTIDRESIAICYD